MGALIDARFDALRGRGLLGSISDMLLQFYLSLGAVTETHPDAEFEFLIARGATPGTISDMWFEYLSGEGYTGSLRDMLHQFWDGGAVVLGPERVLNGNFDTSASWTFNAPWSYVGSPTFKARATTASTNLTQPLVLLGGTTYRTKFTISNYTAGDVAIDFTGSTLTTGTLRSGNNTFIEDLLCLAATITVTMRLNPGTPFSGDIDNVSVREVL